MREFFPPSLHINVSKLSVELCAEFWNVLRRGKGEGLVGMYMVFLKFAVQTCLFTVSCVMIAASISLYRQHHQSVTPSPCLPPSVTSVPSQHCQ